MAGAGNHSDKLVKEENIMKSIKDLKLESLNIPKFAAERIDPENVSELSDDELVRLDVTTIGDHDPHRLRVLCANAEKKNISLWLQLLLANAWLFSADVVTFVCLASRHASIENSVVDRKTSAFPCWALAQSIPGVSIPPRICWAFVIPRFGN